MGRSRGEGGGGVRTWTMPEIFLVFRGGRGRWAVAGGERRGVAAGAATASGGRCGRGPGRETSVRKTTGPMFPEHATHRA